MGRINSSDSVKPIQYCHYTSPLQFIASCALDIKYGEILVCSVFIGEVRLGYVAGTHQKSMEHLFLTK